MSLIDSDTDRRDAMTVGLICCAAGVFALGWSALLGLSPLVPSWVAPVFFGGLTVSGLILAVHAATWKEYSDD